ncbi:Uncharacterised protein [Mycobacteroides abscessus]|nr:Uncharacterised protein [Mycobacteroides abscessus]
MPIHWDCASLRAQPKYSSSAVIIVNGVPTVVITAMTGRRIDTVSSESSDAVSAGMAACYARRP